jgi:hypothetical protein
MVREALVKRVLEGDGVTSHEARRAAFENNSDLPLIGKVAKAAWKVTDEDVATAKTTLSEDAIFELVISAAIGEATRQLDAALAALDAVEE